eukprot:TRINITY_DN25578_c0_g3_i14.p1 TRINITY_DN25578_c0_g3~~TRINITY_DN25578_c0_g3_i14.p1  ORF type:complete len:1219 (+),score=387.50 TRINITY_DN25578_c0_g3_i14:529-3657(+)
MAIAPHAAISQQPSELYPTLDMDVDSSGGGYVVTWSGNITGLRLLNRFLHMTLRMENPNQNNMSVLEFTRLQMEQLVYTDRRSHEPFNATVFLTMSCAFNQDRCSTLQVPVSEMPWSKAYNISISLIDPPAEMRPFLHTASIVFQYQKSDYTKVEIVFRTVMVFFTIYNMIRFYRKLKKVPLKSWLTEQVYIFVAFIFLTIYLDPFYLLATYQNPAGNKTGFWSLILFLEFHSSTYFLLYAQVLVVVLLTAVRRTDGHVKRETHIVCLLWLLFMMAFDLYIAETDNEHGDYSSTFVWFLFTHDLSTLGPGEATMVLCAVFLEAGWLIWTIRGVYRTKRKLRSQPYFPTRHRQIAFRYIYFMFGGLLVYKVVTSIITWLMNNGFSVTYRSTQELGAVVLAFVFVHLVAYIYLPAFATEKAPPAPCDPNWRNATWKRVKWKPEWYEWLAEHGGSLYFFVKKSEQARYLRAQKEAPEEEKAADLDDTMAYTGNATAPTLPTQAGSETPNTANSNPTASPAMAPSTAGTQEASDDEHSFEHSRHVHSTRGVSNVTSSSSRKMHSTSERPRSRSLRFSITGVVDGAAKVTKMSRMLVTEPLRILHEALFSEGYRGCPRLFFCLETCTDMLNLSYAIYAEIPASHLLETKGRGSFTVAAGDRIQRVCVAATTLAAAILTLAEEQKAGEAVGSQDATDADQQTDDTISTVPARQTLSIRLHSLLDKLSNNINGRSTPETLPLEPRQVDESTDPLVVQYGHTLFDAIDVADMLTLITTVGEGRDRHMAVAFRGTWNKSNAINDLKVYRTRWDQMEDVIHEERDHRAMGRDCSCSDTPLLHAGFQDIWEEIREPVMRSIQECLDTFDFLPTICITGHSLGGAMAGLCGYTMTIEMSLLPVVYTFGCPKMGNRAFQRRYNATVPNTFRIVNEHDFVAHWSFTCANFHVGREVCVSKGNLLVEPTWIEQTFQPTKRGAKYSAHSLVKYAETINLICRRFRIPEKCLTTTDQSARERSLYELQSARGTPFEGDPEAQNISSDSEDNEVFPLLHG